MIKTRAGRHTKPDQPRFSSGRIDYRNVQREDPTKLPKWNRYRENVDAMMGDPRMATQRGKMFFTRQLTEPEFETANRWAEMLERYDQMILGARRSPKPPALERVSAGESGDYDPEVVERFRATFKAAHDVVLGAGKIAEAALNKLCRDEASSAALPDAKKAIALLAVHLGLVKRGKR